MAKLVLVVLFCLVAAATAYYQRDRYGSKYDEPAYHTYDEYEKDPGYGDYDYDSGYDDEEPSYGEQEVYEPPRRSRGRGYGRRSAYRQSSYDSYDDGYDSPSPYSDSYDSQDDDGYGYDDEQDYAPRRSYGRRNGRRMNRYGRSGTYGYAKPKKHVPVIIKKKKQKKVKTISVHQGFYIPGGTAIFGKFKDLKSCQKACELTPTCFSGDFNPWLNKCYMHANLTACQSMRAHKQITHFKKVPCNIVETPRGLITLGAASYGGLQQKGIDSLMDCIKKCATAGGGVAPAPDTHLDTPQLCFGVDYDFADHTCYFHTNIAICGGNDDDNAIPLTPVSLFANPSTINILICPITSL